MLRANQFLPVAFKATMVGFNLTHSLGRLAAKLLVDHGDSIDDNEGFRMSAQATQDDYLELIIRDRGLLTITPLWARFEGGLLENSHVTGASVTESTARSVDLLTSILKFQNSSTMALNFELTWILRDHTTSALLVEELGLVNAFNGLFATSRSFEIRGDTTVELPGLYMVDSEVTAGRLENYGEPENIGIQIKHRSPDNRFGSTAPIDYSRPLVDRFFTASARVMEQQLGDLFPSREIP